MALLTTVKQRVGAALLALSAAGAVTIVQHEGMRNTAYVDPVGIVTVCAGHTATAKLGQTLSKEQCAYLLKQDVREAEQAIKRLVKVPVTQNQYDALVSFVFNVGTGNFAKSTLLRRINTNDCWGAAKEFPRWSYAGGRQLPGLIKRRADEARGWASGCQGAP